MWRSGSTHHDHHRTVSAQRYCRGSLVHCRPRPSLAESRTEPPAPPLLRANREPPPPSEQLTGVSQPDRFPLHPIHLASGCVARCAQIPIAPAAPSCPPTAVSSTEDCPTPAGRRQWRRQSSAGIRQSLTKGGKSWEEHIVSGLPPIFAEHPDGVFLSKSSREVRLARRSERLRSCEARRPARRPEAPAYPPARDSARGCGATGLWAERGRASDSG